ncbi:MAG: CDP-alcohol phosphatidyltransferase family protein [Ruminococcaceae bacterium]|nr:CDP-alcohol phosphatidyltransferase family protein [Oscillospiraceae bacterium]
MKKHFADIITGLRIVGSILLLFFPAFSVEFYITYLLCGLSDMIDGTIARKTNAVSSFGSKLDTAADFVFMAVCAFKLLPLVNLPVWLWIWIAVIAIMKGTNIVLGFVRRKKLVAYHTALNKTTGLMLFLLLFTLQWINPTYSLAVVCAVATVTAVQERCYTIKTNDK